jgi:hypothetical protein
MRDKAGWSWNSLQSDPGLSLAWAVNSSSSGKGISWKLSIRHRFLQRPTTVRWWTEVESSQQLHILFLYNNFNSIQLWTSRPPKKPIYFLYIRFFDKDFVAPPPPTSICTECSSNTFKGFADTAAIVVKCSHCMSRNETNTHSCYKNYNVNIIGTVGMRLRIVQWGHKKLLLQYSIISKI